MKLEDIGLLNIGVMHLVASHIESEIPFHLVMETTNWEPKLPNNVKKVPEALFSFVGDTLRTCKVSDGGVYLFIDIAGNHYHYELDDNSLILAMYQDNGTNRPGTQIFIRPEYADFDVELNEEEGLEHSRNMLLQNPDNENFFK